MYPQAVELWRQSVFLSERLDPKMLFTPPWRFQRLERFAVQNTDGLITVSEELLDYFVDRYGVEGPTGVVHNVPDLDRLDSMPVEHLGYEDEFVISLIGGFTEQRRLESAIEAMPKILESIPEAKLLLVDDGHDNYVTRLRELSEELGVNDSVEFTGWVDFERIRSYYEASDVTLVLYRSAQAAEFALPNKLFQAMAFGTPIVGNDLTSLRRILNETEAGITFSHESGLADTIIRLFENDEDLRNISDNGRKAIEDS